MSTATIRKTFEVVGVRTDVTSFTLGIVRADTGAVVVAAGTAMTNTATGVYEYTFTTTGVDYTASFVAVYGGNAISWTETISTDVEETIPLPALTGDYLIDTINSLLCERLRLARNGPHPSYSVHGHNFAWTAYLTYLDKRIEALRKELAQTLPWEEIGVAF